MSTFVGSYKSLLQGVSQQVPRARLPGQHKEQINALSDIVTNIRRRPGSEARRIALEAGSAPTGKMAAWFTEVAGTRLHVQLECSTGTIRLLAPDYSEVAVVAGGDYLTTANPGDIRAATVGPDFFLCNIAKKPARVFPGTYTGDNGGYFFIQTGKFSQTYSISVDNGLPVTYTTPNGTAVGDAEKADPVYIATQLANLIQSSLGYTVSRTGAYVFITEPGTSTPRVVSSSTGSLIVQTSGRSRVAKIEDLPAKLPDNADGYIVSVGKVPNLSYYKYEMVNARWVETGAPNSPNGILFCPVRLHKDAGPWALDTTPFEGRLSGDEENNETPRFITEGITGMSSYQGRLVLMSGPAVSLSASTRPTRFYRSTVESLLDNDPIHLEASGGSSASYAYGVPYQRDLVLFSASYQAVIPGGNTAITPRTGMLTITSTYETDVTSPPVPTGRTVYYPAPRSASYFGVLELIPNQYTESQYISADATEHLPKYLKGRCRFSAGSSVSSMIVFGQTTDLKALVVNEFSWSGNEKQQSAWHTWKFRHDIATAYFAGEELVVVFQQNGYFVTCTIDPRIGVLDSSVTARPFLDLYSRISIESNLAPVPSWLQAFDPAWSSVVRLAEVSGPTAGEEVGREGNGIIRTVESYPEGDVYVGFPFETSLTVTPIVLKDPRTEEILNTEKMTVLRMMIETLNTGPFDVTIKTPTNDGEETEEGTLSWTSPELQLGQPRDGGEQKTVVPVRAKAAELDFTVSTSDLNELNIIGIEYMCRYLPRYRRR